MSLIKEKRGFNMVSNPDSIWSRSAAHRNVMGKDEPNEQQAGGADIAKKMDFDIEPIKSVFNTEPLSFMDVVYDIWGMHDDEPNSDEEDEKRFAKRATPR